MYFTIEEIQNGLENFFKDGNVYLVVECAFYSTTIKQIFLTKEEALASIQCTEEELKEKRVFLKEHPSTYKYKDIMEVNIHELIECLISNVKNRTISVEANVIREKAEENIQREVDKRLYNAMQNEIREVYRKVKKIFSKDYNIY